MALAAPFPPWLDVTPQTYTGAMGAGARIGLEARSEDIRQQQAADRLQLAYEQLAAKEEMANQALEGKMNLASSNLELRDKAMELNAAIRGRGLDQQKANIDSLIAKRDFDEQLATSKAQGAKANIHWGKDGQPYLYDPDKNTMSPVPGVPSSTGKGNTYRLNYPPGAPGEPMLTTTYDQKGYDAMQAESARNAGIAKANALAKRAQKQLPGTGLFGSGVFGNEGPFVNLLYSRDVGLPHLPPGVMRANPEEGSPFGPSTLTPTPQGAPSGRIITDRTGKKFRYLGTMADPKKDRDKSHWEEVE